MDRLSVSDARVLVLWADPGAENLGLRALAEGARQLSELVWSSTRTTFHSHNTSGTPLSRRLVLRDIGRRHGPVKVILRRFDIILDTGGGDSFSDIYGLRRLLLQAYIYKAADAVNVPIVMTPQTVGPFDTIVGRLVGRFVLKKSAFCSVRDSVSGDAVVSLIGTPPDRIATDLVFVSGDSGDLDAHIIRRPASEKPRIVVNVSGLLWQPNPHVEFSAYRSSVRSLIQWCLSANYEVDLLAHVLDSPLSDNDVPVVLELAKEFTYVGVSVPDSLSGVRESLAGASIVVASRMHACLNALSVGTPAIAWAYSRKFEPLLDALGWEHVLDLRSEDDIVAATLDLLNPSSLPSLSRAAHDVAARGRGMIDGLVESMKAIPVGAS